MPFPYCIAYVLVVGVAIGIKCLYEPTLIVSALLSLGSVIEVLAVWTLIIVAAVNGEVGAGFIVLIIGLVLNYLCNAASMLLTLKFLDSDPKFMETRTVAYIPIRIIQSLLSHKFH